MNRRILTKLDCKGFILTWSKAGEQVKECISNQYAPLAGFSTAHLLNVSALLHITETVLLNPDLFYREINRENRH